MCASAGERKRSDDNLRSPSGRTTVESHTCPPLKKKEAPVAQIDQGSSVFPLNVVTNQPSQKGPITGSEAPQLASIYIIAQTPLYRPHPME